MKKLMTIAAMMLLSVMGLSACTGSKKEAKVADESETAISFAEFFTFQPLKLLDLKTFCNFAAMKAERTISAYKICRKEMT